MVEKSGSGPAAHDAAGPGDEGPAAIQLAQAGGASDPIGTVQEISGTVTLTRVDGSTVAAAPGTPVYQDDVVATAPDGSVALVFVDGTSFSLGSDAEITLDTLIYNPGGGGNALNFSVAKGAFVFITGSIAGADGAGMEVQIPAGTVGIRGTTVGCGPTGGSWTCALLRDPDGSVGRVVFRNNAGEVILDEPLEASSLPDPSLLPSEPTVYTREDVLALFGDALPGLPQVLEQILNPEEDINPEAGPNEGEQGGPPGAPNQGHLLTPFGPTLSLAELTGADGEGDADGLGGSLADSILAGLVFFDQFGQPLDLVQQARAPSPPIDTDPTEDSVSELAVDGAIVGITALSLDPEGGAVTYSLLDDADGRFAIDPVTGVVTVADASRLDYETTPTYTLIVVATNALGFSAAAPLIVNLLDENDEAPVVDPAGPFDLAELSAPGTVVGTVQASDIDTVGGPLTYAIVSGNDDGYFEIDPATGVITLTADGAAALADFESAPPPFVLGIVASDGVNQSAVEPVTIALSDVNELSVAGESPVVEGGLGKITLSLDFPAAADVTVELKLGAAGDDATAGLDFDDLVLYTADGTPVFGTPGPNGGILVTIPAGAASLDVFVAAAADGLFGEPAEGLTVTVVGADVPVSVGSAEIEIVDNDAPPVLTIDNVTVSEGDPSDGSDDPATFITFTVTKSGATAVEATVQYDVLPGSAGTPGDYAVADPLSGVLVFAPGETTKTITLAITDDIRFEPTESFTVQLSSPVNAALGDNGAGVGVGVGTILDEDPPSAAFRLNEIGVGHAVAPGAVTDFIELRNGADSAESLRDLHVEIIGQDGAISTGFTLPDIMVPPGGFAVLVPAGSNQVMVFVGDGSAPLDLAGEPAAVIDGAGVGNWNLGGGTAGTLGVNLSDGLAATYDTFVANRANPALFSQPSLWTGATPGAAGYLSAASLLAAAVGLADHGSFNGGIGDQAALLQALGLAAAPGGNGVPAGGAQSTLFSRVDLAGSHDAAGWTMGGANSIGQLNDASGANPQDPVDVFDPAQSDASPGEGQTVIAAGDAPIVATGGAGPDFLYGGAGNDVLGDAAVGPLAGSGEGHNDLLFGGGGADRLFGGTGADLLIDVDGEDLLVGGAGNDILLGNIRSLDPDAARPAGDHGDILVGDNLASANLSEDGGQGQAGPGFNFVLALDGSGSMVFSFDGQQTSGVPPEQQRLALAKDAYKALIDRIVAEGIGGQTTVNLILFSTVVVQNQVFTLDTVDNIAAAKAFIDSFQAVGGTELEPAMTAAAGFLTGQPQGPDTRNFVYLLGDGADNTGYNSSLASVRPLYDGSVPNLTIRAFGIGTIGGSDVDPDQLDEVVTGIDGPNGTAGQPDQSVFISNPDEVANSIVAGGLSGATPGHDVIVGGDGDDFIFGDNLIAGLTAAQLDAFLADPFGQIAAIAADPMLQDLLNIAGVSDDIDGGGGDDVIFGQGGDDEIRGGDGDDTIYGGAGDDSLFGESGADTLWGGAGDDRISVGSGDSAYGEAGTDIFVLADNAGFARVEGGTGGTGNAQIDGGDMLVFDGLLDLTDAATLAKISGIETISMREVDGSTGTAADRLVLNFADVLALGDATFDPNGDTYGRRDAIRVDGDQGDVLQLVGGGWHKVTAGNAPAGYDVWAHDPSLQGTSEDAYVLVQTTVAVSAS